MPTVDWKGFFSNPATYELPEEEFQGAYKALVEADENMRGFAQEDHQAFISEGMKLNPMRPPLTEGQADIAAALMPVAHGAVSAPEFNDIVNQQVADELTPAVMFAQQQMQRMGIAPETSRAALGALSRGNITTVPETWLTMLPGVAAQAAGAAEYALPDDSQLWSKVKDTLNWGATEGVPQFVDVMTRALESGAAGLLPEQQANAVREVSDVKNVKDAVDWAAGAFQQAGASSLPIIAASLIPMVGPPAALAISNAFVTGEYQQDLYRTTGEADPGAEAVVRNIPAGLLEMLGAETEAGALLKAGKEAAQLAARQAVKFLKTAGIESGTEGAQEALKIANLKDKAGESLNPMDWSADDWKQIANAAAAGAVGGGGFAAAGLVSAPGEYTGSKRINQQIEDFKTMLNPEERAQAGILDYAQRPGVREDEARFRATEALDYLTSEERERFVKSEALDLEALSRRTQKPVEQVETELAAAEEQAQKIMTPPRQLAQPSPEGEDVIRAIESGIDELAQEAEDAGQAELANARRARKGQVQIVEAETLFERGIVGLGKVLGGAPKVVLFTQPQIEGEPSHGGVFVSKGLIAVDVSDNIAPKVVLGTMFHELSHNVEKLNPELYRGTMEALRASRLWERSSADLAKIMPAEKITDEEVFAHIFEQKGVATSVMQALADYASVENMAKAPGPVRAVVEWLAEKFRFVTGKLQMTSDLEGLNLEQMKKIGALRADPELRRNAARATLELVNMLKAAPAATQEGRTGDGVQEAETEVAPMEEAAPATGAAAPEQMRLFSRSFTKLREQEGMSPAGLDSVQHEINRFYEVRQEKFNELRSAGVPRAMAVRQASKYADDWVKSHLKVLDNNELSDEQRMLSQFAQDLGVRVVWYQGDSPTLGGFVQSRGTIWIHAGAKMKISFRQILAHEMMHEFRRRYPALWQGIAARAQELMPEEWAQTKADVKSNRNYADLTGEELDNEVFAHLVHMNANEFWAAVAKAGEDPKAPVAFRRLFQWIGEFVKRMTGPMLEWARSVGIIARTDMETTPAEQLGREIVGLLSETTAKAEGPYQTFSPAEHAAEVRNAIAERRGVMHRQINVDYPEEAAAFTKRMVAETERKPTPEPTTTQLPLFSRRAGYPPAAQTPRQLASWRARLVKMAMRGLEGKFWYERSSGATMQMTAGDLDMARKFTRLVAVYSPRTGVMVNWHRALTAWGWYLAGYSKADFLKRSLGDPDNHRKAADILYDDAEWSGEKTNSFFSNLFKLLDEDAPDRATIDLWMMRAFGFSGEAPTEKQYEEMEKEVKRVAKALNVETHQAQAMIWVYAKTVWEDPRTVAEVLRVCESRDIVTHVPALKKDGTPKLDKRGRPKVVPTPEYLEVYREVFNRAVKKDLKTEPTQFPISEEALTTFATGLERRVAVISQEAIPGPGAGWLQGLADAPFEVKVAFTLAVERALMGENGFDVIAEEMGFGPIGDLNSMLLGNSAYFDGERVQLNPSRQIKIPAAAQRGAESSRRWDPASLDQAKLYAVIRGMLTGQDSQAGYRRFDHVFKVKERNMAEFNQGRRLSYDQQEELVRVLSGVVQERGADRETKLEGWEIALYPSDNGVVFIPTGALKMNNAEFQAAVKETIARLSFQRDGKMETFAGESFYIQAKESKDGSVETYADIIQGREELLKRVEDRVADQLARVYVEYAGRGYGTAPEWAVVRTGTEETLRRDAQSYPHYWHFSVAEVKDEGILRERAGTGATGAEAARFRYDPETGKLDPESAVVHLYTPSASAEEAVVSTAAYVNKVVAGLRLIPTDSHGLADLYRKHGNDVEAVYKELRSLGYDGIVDVTRGFVQVYRDIDTSEIVEGHELTPKERRAWKGALRLEEIEDGETYDHLRVPRVQELKRADVEFVASKLKDDGTAIFPKGTDEKMVRQYFNDVKSTSVGVVASNPRRAKFSRTVVNQHETPVGEQRVVDDEVEFGTRYSSRSGPGWSLPHLDRWGMFVKRIQDSFTQAKRLNEVFTSEGISIADRINVHLMEELYHGKVQEETQRIDDRYVHPLLVELRQLAKGRKESYTELLAKFDDYLHARHAPERNKHVREVWYTKKLELLNVRKGQLQDRISGLNDELNQSTSQATTDRLKNSIKFWELKLQQVEQKIIATQNQPELGSGMTDVKATQVMQQTRLDGLDKTFGRLAGRFVDPLLKEVLSRQLAEGMITQKEYDNVARYKYYVPLKGKGVEGDLEDVFTLYGQHGSNTGFDIRGSELPFVVGREVGSEVNPILAQVIVDAMADVDRIERNRVAVALLELAEQYPNDELWEINKEVKKRIYDRSTGVVREVEDWWARNEANVVGAKRGGETYFITLKDRGMVEAMKGLGVENLWKWVGAVRSIMRTIAQLYTTFSPEFVLTNFARDWQQALVSTTTDMGKEAALEVAKTSSRAVRGILAANFPDTLGRLRNEYTDYYHELKAAGGKVGFFGMRGVEDQQKAILGEMNSGAVATTMRGLRRAGSYISAVNEATENGIRLATYVAAVKRGYSKEKAASLAKNVTVNFNRRGDVGGAIGAGYLFFNAGVQGVDRFFKSMKTPAGQKLAAAYVAIGFLTAVWSRAAMGDDDDDRDLYDKISNFTKGRHWIIADPWNKGQFIQIPMPYGFGVWGQLGKELEYAIFSDQDRAQAAAEAAVRMVSGLTTHFSPIGETSFEGGFYAMARPIVPTLLEPWADILANETYWGGHIYPAKAPWDRRSDSARVYPGRTMSQRLLIDATQKLNELTGGSHYRSGVVDLNANALSYLFSSYIGPTGNFIKRPLDLVQKKIHGDDTLWNDWIILRRFLSETAPQYYVPGEFYDAVTDVQAADDELKYLKDQGASYDDVTRWKERHGWKLGLVQESRRVQRLIRDVRDKARDDEEARKRVLEIQRGFVKRYLQTEQP